MKNIIPFKKEVIFKTNISEVTSISLENTLNIVNDSIEGDFIVSGEYKITDNSVSVEPFNLKLPFKIIVSDYDISDATLDIDDFYYEIINDNILSVSIDVLLDKIKEKKIIDEIPDLTKDIDLIEDEPLERHEEKINEAECEEVKEEKEDDIRANNLDNKEKLDSIFSKMTNEEKFVSYNVYIIRSGDTIDSILDKYDISKELLEEYNDLSNLELGDKLIIPDTNEDD